MAKPIQLADNEYVLIESGAWFTVGNFSIRINKADEYVMVSIFKLGKEDEGAITGTYAFNNEIEED